MSINSILIPAAWISIGIVVGIIACLGYIFYQVTNGFKDFGPF
jgi:hypothetical protein